MTSEVRRAAKALMETRVAAFRSRYPVDASVRRLQQAIAAAPRAGLSRGVEGEATDARVVLRERRMRGAPHACFEGSWIRDDDGVALAGRFLPSTRAQRFLTRASVALTVLVLASAWSWIVIDEMAVRYLVPLFTFFAIFAFPFVVVALNSEREAEEARIARAIRHVLADEDAAFPAQGWADEEK